MELPPERLVHRAVHHGPELSPRPPIASDVLRALGRQVVESLGDAREIRDLDLLPGLDPFAQIERAERPMYLVEQKRKSVEYRWRTRAGERVVGNACEEAVDGGDEARFLVRLTNERVVDALAMMDSARRQTEGTSRVEGLDRQQQSATAPSDDHADLTETIALPDRILEGVVDCRVDHDRRAVARRQVGKLALRGLGQLHVLEPTSARAFEGDRPVPREAARPPSSSCAPRGSGAAPAGRTSNRRTSAPCRRSG